MPQSMLNVTVKLPGRRVKVAHPAPGGPARPDELLPFMYAVDEAVIAVGVGLVFVVCNRLGPPGVAPFIYFAF